MEKVKIFIGLNIAVRYKSKAKVNWIACLVGWTEKVEIKINKKWTIMDKCIYEKMLHLWKK